MRFRQLVPIALTAAILVSPSAPRAETLSPDIAIEDDVKDAVLRYVNEKRRSFGSSAAALYVRSETALKGGKVIRLGQRHDGLPVLEADVAVTVLGRRIIAATGHLSPINRTLGKATLSRKEAHAALLKLNATAKISGARLAMQVRGGVAQPVWELTAMTTAPHNSWLVRVDARSGEVLSGLSTRRHETARGYAYLPNPQVGQLQAVTLQRLTDKTQLTGPYVTVQSCSAKQNQLDCSQKATFDTAEDYRLAQPDEPSMDDAFSEIHTYYHVDSFHHWLAQSFGFKRKGASQQIGVYVNFHYYGQNGQQYGMANAFFGDVTGDGKGELVFGQDQRDFAYDGDVVYHEFTHSAVNETSDLSPFFDDLGYNSFPLALNEAFADLMSCAYTGDGAVGEYAGGAYANGAIRDLEGDVRTCDDLIAESHRDGVIWGRLNWTIRKKVDKDPTLDVARYDAVMYKVMVGLSKNATFEDAAQLLLTVAKAEDAAIGAIAKAEVEARGLLDCKRILPLTPEKPRSGYMLGTASVMGVNYVPAGLQYKVQVPADATKMTIALDGTVGNGQSIAAYLGAYVRKGSPISFTGQQPQRDFTMDSSQLDFTLEVGDAKNPLEPGATYYVLPLNVARMQLGYEATVAFVQKPQTSDAAPVEPDAGVTPDQQAPSPDQGQGNNASNSSGGCAVDAGAAPSGLVLLLLLGLVTLRRRD